MSQRTRTASLLACLLVAALPAAAQQARTKVILDTDIGTDIDDGWALGYALKSPSFELVGVTVTDGDTPQRPQARWKLLYRLGGPMCRSPSDGKTPPEPADRVDYQFAWAEDFRRLKTRLQRRPWSFSPT